jgi:general secretion pathway protein K
MNTNVPPSPPGASRGAALITAMLITALVTIAAVAMASRQQLDLRRSATLLGRDQAYLYALGAESWAIQILARDREDNQRDDLGEDWAETIPPILLEQGQLQGQITDLQGRFNLNNLVQSNGPVAFEIQRYKNLLERLDLDPDLADTLVDWLDPDPDARIPGGAEDLEYLSRDPAYRTANRRLRSITELRLVKGYGPEVYERLAPFVSALPQPTPINVNTAPPEVLLALSPEVTEGDAASLVEARADDGFPSLEAFLKRDELAGTGLTPQGLSLASDYFLAHGQVTGESGTVNLYSLIHRGDGGRTRVLYHSQAPF